MVREFVVESMDLDFPGTDFCVYKFYQSSTQRSAAKQDILIFHHHLCYELHFLSKGIYRFVTQNQTVEVSGGELLIIPPGIRHYSVQKSEEAEDICLCMAVDRKAEEEGFYDYFKTSLDDAALVPVKVTDDLMNNFVLFENMSNGTDIKHYCYMKRMVCNILVDLFEVLNGFDCRSRKNVTYREKTHIHFLLENYVNDPKYTLADIAELLHYSERQVTRMILDTYGSTLCDLRNSRQTELARMYLEKGHSVQKSSELAGFRNTESFRRYFKKYVGVTPSEYQKEHQKSSGKKQ